MDRANDEPLNISVKSAVPTRPGARFNHAIIIKKKHMSHLVALSFSVFSVETSELEANKVPVLHFSIHFSTSCDHIERPNAGTRRLDVSQRSPTSEGLQQTLL